MLVKILIALGALLIGAVVLVTLQPADFRVTRSMAMTAPPAVVFEQVNDFHNWKSWSPWANLDPKAKESFEGAEAGEGAIFKWDGNSAVGAGSMTIIESRPGEMVRIRLDFLKPFKGTHTAEFTFKPENGKTLATWSMFGTNNFIGKAMGLIMNCDKMMGGYFEEGLTKLKAVVEPKEYP